MLLHGQTGWGEGLNTPGSVAFNFNSALTVDKPLDLFCLLLFFVFYNNGEGWDLCFGAFLDR